MRRSAFTLLEVVVALGVFAIGMVAVIGLLAPVTKSVSSSAEAEAAAGVAEGLLARLRALPFDSAVLLVQDEAAVLRNDSLGNYNPNDGTHPAVIFATAGGDAGIYDATKSAWIDSAGQPLVNADKFFEIELVRNSELSPTGSDAAAAMLAFTMRVRWPSWRPSADGAGVQVGAGQPGVVAFDHGKQQVLFFAGSIRR